MKIIDRTGFMFLWAAIFVLGPISSTVYAATVTLNFDVEVYEVNDPTNILGSALGLSAAVGDTFSAGYNIDSSPSATYDGPGFPPVDTSAYTVSPVSTFANYEGTALNATGMLDGNVFIGNGYDGGGGELVDAWRVLARLLPATSTHPQLSLGIILFNETNTRLDDSSFFVNNSFDGWDNAVVYITSTDGLLMLASGAASVPLPSALWVFVSGLLGLAGLIRKRR